MKILRDVMLAYTPLKNAKKAHKEKPEDALTNFSLGCAYYNSGKDKKAAKHLEKYLELLKEPDKEEKAEESAGQEEKKEEEGKKEKQPEKQEQEEEKARPKGKPDRFVMEAHFRLGVIRLREKKKEKAKEHFKKVEELDKNNKKRMKEHIAWAKLKLLLAGKKKQKEAKKAARELIDKFPKGMYLAKCLMIIGDICLKERDIDGAVDAWLELQKKRFGSIEYPEMQKLLKKYWNMSKQSKKGK